MNEEFLKRMKEYLSDEDYYKLLKSYNEKPIRSFRINKIEPQKLINNMSINVEKIPYDKDGYYLYNDGKFGNHPYHHLGAIYFQEPSAMAPVNMYDFKGDEIVLDLCAAPGGKSCQILSRIPNGILFSNDPSKKRSQILFSNIERLGFKNTVVLNETPQRLSSNLKGLFDVILVDAPCSGEGMMRKDEDARNQWTKELTLSCALLDKEILQNANKMLKNGGILIYSTCTFARCEDEEIIKYLIDELNYELLPANPLIKECTIEDSLKDTLKFYPFTGKGEGQFMAVLRKQCDQESNYKFEKTKKDNDIKIVEKFLNDNLKEIPEGIIKKIGNRYYLTQSNIDLSRLNVITNGVELGEVVKNRFEPYHHLFKTLGNNFKNILELDINDPRVIKYLRGEEIQASIPNGYGVIKIDSLILGGFKASNGNLKNHYPKGLRNF